MLVSSGRIRFRRFVHVLHRSQEKGLEQRKTDLYGERWPHLSHYIAVPLRGSGHRRLLRHAVFAAYDPEVQAGLAILIGVKTGFHEILAGDRLLHAAD